MNQYRQSGPQGLGKTQRLAVFVLFFISGFAGLVYEVLWMKELGLLFGNTAQAAATTLAALRNQLNQIRRDAPANIHRKLIGIEAVPVTPNHVLLHYAGNLTGLDDLFIDSPIINDNLPHIEYNVPKSVVAVESTQTPWFTKGQLIDFYGLILDLSPPESDPYLNNIELRNKSLPVAGFHLHSARIFDLEGDSANYSRSINQFNKYNLIN